MSTPLFGTREMAAASIKPYWDFVQNPANKEKNVVKVNNNKLGIAKPLAFRDDHITFINKEGLESISDPTKQIVDHFQEALAKKYQSKYGNDFVNHLLTSDDLTGALVNGLSHHVVSRVYEKVCLAEMPQLLAEVPQLLEKAAACSRESERASSAAITASPLKAKQFALEAQEQFHLAKDILTRLEKSSAFFPNNQELQDAVKTAKKSSAYASASAKDTAETVDRNHRLRGGPMLKMDHSSKEKVIINFSEAKADQEEYQSTEIDEEKTSLLRAAHDALLEKLDKKALDEKMIKKKEATGKVHSFMHRAV